MIIMLGETNGFRVLLTHLFIYQTMLFDEVAADFPDMTIVMAHAGQDLWPEALNVARMKPNMMLELSMWQPKFK